MKVFSFRHLKLDNFLNATFFCILSIYPVLAIVNFFSAVPYLTQFGLHISILNDDAYSYICRAYQFTNFDFNALPSWVLTGQNENPNVGSCVSKIARYEYFSPFFSRFGLPLSLMFFMLIFKEFGVFLLAFAFVLLFFALMMSVFLKSDDKYSKLITISIFLAFPLCKSIWSLSPDLFFLLILFLILRINISSRNFLVLIVLLSPVLLSIRENISLIAILPLLCLEKFNIRNFKKIAVFFSFFFIWNILCFWIIRNLGEIFTPQSAPRIVPGGYDEILGFLFSQEGGEAFARYMNLDLIALGTRVSFFDPLVVSALVLGVLIPLYYIFQKDFLRMSITGLALFNGVLNTTLNGLVGNPQGVFFRYYVIGLIFTTYYLLSLSPKRSGGDERI